VAPTAPKVATFQAVDEEDEEDLGGSDEANFLNDVRTKDFDERTNEHELRITAAAGTNIMINLHGILIV